MKEDLSRLLFAFETHDALGIKSCFENGINPNMIYENKPLIHTFINMYTRGPKFKDCIRFFVEAGLEWNDDILLAVLLDNADWLESLLSRNQQALNNKYTFECTFTPLFEASLLHICAEYNHLACAKILVDKGIDINSTAGYDNIGFGGQTPIFHTVNQDANKSMDMLRFLLAHHTDVDITIKGLIWGKGYEWETYIPSVNPVSYAMMGLLRQFQRKEKDIYEVVSLLMEEKYGVKYEPANVPNKYLL